MRKKRMVIQFDLNFNYVDSYESIYDACKKNNVDKSRVFKCATYWSMNCDNEKWKKNYKNHPIKQAGGYIWRWYSDFENRD